MIFGLIWAGGEAMGEKDMIEEKEMAGQARMGWVRWIWRVLYLAVQCTWGAVQTLAGAVLFMQNLSCPHSFSFHHYSKISYQCKCFSTGKPFSSSKPVTVQAGGRGVGRQKKAITCLNILLSFF